MGDHPLLPPLQDTFKPGDAEAHVRAVGRRFPALCKLLATLTTASPPKSYESDVSCVSVCARVCLCLCVPSLVFFLVSLPCSRHFSFFTR